MIFAVGLLAGSIFGESIVVYDSQGFERFTLGSAVGQTEGFIINEKAQEGGAFSSGEKCDDDVLTIEKVDGHGKVLALNKNSGGWGDAFLDLGWRGDLSDPAFKGETKYVHLTFDFYDPGVSGGGLYVYRGKERASLQAKVWLQNPLKMQMRLDDPTEPWEALDVQPKSYKKGEWHTFALIMIWEDSHPQVKVFIDGEELLYRGEPTDWFSPWNGIPGWFDSIRFSCLTRKPMYFDNIKVVYSDSETP